MNPPDMGDRFRLAGIGATLPGSLPPARVLAVADALLAAPVTAVEVTLAGSLAATGQVIADLRRRGRQHLLVGAAGVERAGQATALAAAGAQYISSRHYDPAVQAACRQQDAGYLPTVITVFAAQAARQAGLNLLRIPTGGPAGPDFIQALRHTFAGLDLVVAGDFAPADIDAYARAGATAVIVGRTLVAGPDQGMPALITRAREFQRAWERATGGWDARSAPGEPEEER